MNKVSKAKSVANVAWIKEKFPRTTVERKPWRTPGEYRRLRAKTHTHPSKSPPCLITIAPNQGSDFASNRPKKLKDKYQVLFGSHATIGCYFGWLFGDKTACIALYYPQPNKKYTRIGIHNFEQDMIATINHETLHHVLMWLARDPLSQSYDQLDNIVNSLQTAKKLGL